MGKFKQKLIDPFIIPLIVVAVTWFGIMLIGETYLGSYQGDEIKARGKDRIDRPELWVGVGLTLAIIGLMAFLATRPRGSTGPLEKDVAIGSRPFFEEPLPPVDARARMGQPGTVADIAEGFTLYAQSGALAVVHGVLPGGSDYGKRFAGFLYAEGLAGASKELWIPIEAVTAVYPETRSAFLAIKGDETEHFGWSIPPETVRRGPARVRPHTVEEQSKMTSQGR